MPPGLSPQPGPPHLPLSGPSSPWITCPPTSFLGPSSWPPPGVFSLPFRGLCPAVGGAGVSGLNARPECQALGMENPSSCLGFPMASLWSGLRASGLGREEIVDVGWRGGKWGCTKAQGLLLKFGDSLSKLRKDCGVEGTSRAAALASGPAGPFCSGRARDLAVPAHHEAHGERGWVCPGGWHCLEPKRGSGGARRACLQVLSASPFVFHTTW